MVDNLVCWANVGAYPPRWRYRRDMTQRREVTNTIHASLEDIHSCLLHPQFYSSTSEEGEEENTVEVTQTFTGNYLIHVRNVGADFTYTVEPLNTTGFTVTGVGKAGAKLETTRTHTFTPVDESTTEEHVEAVYTVDIPIIGPLGEARWAGLLDQELEGRISTMEAYSKWRRGQEE